MKGRAKKMSLLDVASARYRAAGRFAWQFARGKLRGDPAFSALLERGLIRDGALLDIGCGQGLLAAWLIAARERFDAGEWPAGWPDPPRVVSYMGVELMPADVERARQALCDRAGVPGVAGSGVRFVAADMRTAGFARADTVVMLDVLHYVPIAEQDAVLRRVRDALNPGGVLLLRIGDAGGGFGFHWSQWVDHAVMLARGHGWKRLYCRTLGSWQSSLASLGFTVDPLPMSQGTAFANVLLVARG